jgi:hypothetical protein
MGMMEKSHSLSDDEEEKCERFVASANWYGTVSSLQRWTLEEEGTLFGLLLVWCRLFVFSHFYFPLPHFLWYSVSSISLLNQSTSTQDEIDGN